ncbi:hypothetical protein Bca4012_100279 [Brassica carinata]|uniref:Uncharacterized protein n=1 Tax=Brassica cretica TaxID=69181 RepID=A0A8S9Q8A8_BRACR|nr:hypothetical protein F2Q69_00049958 [Brassica cretica]
MVGAEIVVALYCGKLMHPGMCSLELALGGTKLISGSDGKTVWRHTPWLSTHAAKGPQRPLRRLIQATMYQFTF